MAIDWDKYESGEDEDRTDFSFPAKGQTLKEGDGVEGRYIKKKTNVGKNNSNVYVIEREDGKTVGVWGSTVIDSKFENIAIGKMVAIEYAGEKIGKRGKPYRDFKVGQGIVAVGDEPRW